MQLRLNLLEAQLSARKQIRQDQARELHEILKQIDERDTRNSTRDQAASTERRRRSKDSAHRTDIIAQPPPGSAPIKRATRANRQAVNPRQHSRFGGPVVTIGTSTRSGIGRINTGDQQFASKAANGAVSAKLNHLKLASAKLSSALADVSSNFRILRSREPVPSGFVLVSPDLAEMHKPTLVRGLAMRTSGTWQSAEIADGFRVFNVANSSGGQGGWMRLGQATEESIEHAVFSAIFASDATNRRGIEASNDSAGESDPVEPASDTAQVIQRKDLHLHAPYHFGEGVVCAHSPYGTTISDVWHSREEGSSLPPAGKHLSRDDWHELLRAVKRSLGAYGYRAFLIGLAWETRANCRLEQQVSTDSDGALGSTGAPSLKDGVYPIIHALFERDNADGGSETAQSNPAALKACVCFDFAMAQATQSAMAAAEDVGMKDQLRLQEIRLAQEHREHRKALENDTQRAEAELLKRAECFARGIKLQMASQVEATNTTIQLERQRLLADKDAKVCKLEAEHATNLRKLHEDHVLAMRIPACQQRPQPQPQPQPQQPPASGSAASAAVIGGSDSRTEGAT